MVQDLLQGFVPPDLVGAFDIASLEALPSEYVGDDLRQSRGDMVWRLRFAPHPGTAPPREEWLYLLVLLEFQSTVDPHMAARVLAYTAQTHMKLIRGERLPADGKLPPVLPIVLYNGRARWSAPLDAGEAIAETDAGLAPFQPSQRYLMIDQHALKVEDLPADNLVSAQVALEQGRLASLAPVLSSLGRLLSGDEYASLRRGFAAWVRGMVERSRLVAADPQWTARLKLFAEKGDLEAMKPLLAERIDRYVEQRSMERGLERGMERGLAQGLERERALLSRLAERKFGKETAVRLGKLLAGMDDPERLDEIGEQVIACATGDELLARAQDCAERH